uniref:S-adenosylmethionine transporter n=2 Tax=Salix viminalis TaxID=40686 RepID=A0A6N2KSG5_SALVM
MDAPTFQKISLDTLEYKRCNSPMEPPCRFFASVNAAENKPFYFLHAVYEGMIAGGAAGVIAEAVLYPIDTIKTRLQATMITIVHGFHVRLLMVREIILEGLYSGLAGNLAGVLPCHWGAASSLVRVPTEVVKQRMQLAICFSPDAVRLIVSKEGFKGYGSFLLRDLPFDAIQFCIYEQMLMGYKLLAKRDLKDAEIAIVGAFAGAITGAMTTPLDVVKTRLMVQGSANQYKGIVDCARTIAKEEGTRALLKGVGPRVLWIGVGGAIFFGVLEKTKQILAQRCPEPKM